MRSENPKDLHFSKYTSSFIM